MEAKQELPDDASALQTYFFPPLGLFICHELGTGKKEREEYGDELWWEDQQKGNRRGVRVLFLSAVFIPTTQSMGHSQRGQLLTERPWSDMHLGPNTSLLISSVMLGKAFNSCETQLYHLKSGINISEASCKN